MNFLNAPRAIIRLQQVIGTARLVTAALTKMRVSYVCLLCIDKGNVMRVQCDTACNDESIRTKEIYCYLGPQTHDMIRRFRDCLGRYISAL